MAKAPTPNQTSAPAVKPGAAGGKPAKKETTEEVASKSSGGISVLGLIILTLLASGAGGGFGGLIASQLQYKMSEQAPEKQVEDSKLKHSNISKLQMFSLPLPPITTNLGGTSRVWIRLECTLISPAAMANETTTLTGQISEDIIAYLRTVTPDQLNGPGGFQHLREDLNDRLRIRTNSKDTSVIIQALIIE
jgi:flagellar FliL protein